MGLPPHCLRQFHPLSCFHETGADAGVLVRSSAATAQVEQPAAQALVIVTTNAQHNTRRAVVAIVGNIGRFAPTNRGWIHKPSKTFS